MALPNSETVTSRLALMPDTALKQMAMMYKADPYILPLIISEDGRRKRTRQAAQAQMSQMPKVADAAVDQIGIAQLPTPNMQQMADGGIAGYDDFEFAQRSEPVVRMSGGGAVQKFAGKGEQLVRTTDGGKTWFLDIPKTIRDPSVPYYREIPNPAAALAEMKFPSKEAAIQAATTASTKYSDAPGAEPYTTPLGSALPTVSNTYVNKAGEEKLRPAGMSASDFNKQSKSSRAQDQTATFQGPNDAIVPRFQPGVSDVSAAPSATSTAAQAPGDTPAAPPAAQQGLGSIAIPKTLTPEQAKEQAGQFADFGDARTALKQAEADHETQAARMRTTLSEGLPKTPALQGLEKLLDKQDAETGGEKNKAAGLALLTAGLAIAGGSSRFALQNLKEAIPAVAQYGDALKDIKKMERENMKLRGDIEQARRAEQRDNTKLKLELEDKIYGRKEKLNDMGINLLAKIADTDTRTATSLWTASLESSSRIQSAVAGARANNMGNIEFLERLGAADPNSALRKGYSLKTQEGAEPRLYTEYIKNTEDPINGPAFKQKYPTFEIFKEGYSGSGLQFAAPPASASILKPPKG